MKICLLLGILVNIILFAEYADRGQPDSFGRCWSTSLWLHGQHHTEGGVRMVRERFVVDLQLHVVAVGQTPGLYAGPGRVTMKKRKQT